MSTVSVATTVSSDEGLPSRLRKIIIAALLALVLAGRKVSRIRENAGSWLAFRIILGLAGAGLVILPLSFWDNLLVAPVGLCMFLASILLPPAKPDSAVEEKTRERGEVVVHGGNYFVGRASPVAVQLFIGTERISVLDSQLNELLVVSCAEITAAEVTRLYSRWLLELHWSDKVAEFVYAGFFAEHLARAAQAAVVRAIPAPVSMPQKARSATA